MKEIFPGYVPVGTHAHEAQGQTRADNAITNLGRNTEVYERQRVWREAQNFPVGTPNYVVWAKYFEATGTPWLTPGMIQGSKRIEDILDGTVIRVPRIPKLRSPRIPRIVVLNGENQTVHRDIQNQTQIATILAGYAAARPNRLGIDNLVSTPAGKGVLEWKVPVNKHSVSQMLKTAIGEAITYVERLRIKYGVVSDPIISFTSLYGYRLKPEDRAALTKNNIQLVAFDTGEIVHSVTGTTEKWQPYIEQIFSGIKQL